MRTFKILAPLLFIFIADVANASGPVPLQTRRVQGKFGYHVASFLFQADYEVSFEGAAKFFRDLGVEPSEDYLEITPELVTKFNLDLPPEVIYHFGQMDHLLEDVTERNIPQKVWDNFVMGDQTNYKQVSFRRGLYGTRHPSYGAFFGDIVFDPSLKSDFRGESNEGHQPWFIGIKIKHECRTRENAVVLENVLTHPKFQSWFRAAQHRLTWKTAEEMTSDCFTTGGSAEDDCSRAFQDFLSESHIKAVLDEAWPDEEDGETSLFGESWYIRDRECIENILGTPSEVLQMMSHTQNVWRLDPAAFMKSHGRGDATYLIFVRALADLKKSDVPLDALRKLKRESQLVEDKELDPASLRNTIAGIVDAFTKCSKEGKQKEFQAEADQFLRSTIAAKSEDKYDILVKAAQAFERKSTHVCR